MSAGTSAWTLLVTPEAITTPASPPYAMIRTCRPSSRSYLAHRTFNCWVDSGTDDHDCNAERTWLLTDAAAEAAEAAPRLMACVRTEAGYPVWGDVNMYELAKEDDTDAGIGEMGACMGTGTGGVIEGIVRSMEMAGKRCCCWLRWM